MPDPIEEAVGRIITEVDTLIVTNGMNGYDVNLNQRCQQLYQDITAAPTRKSETIHDFSLVLLRDLRMQPSSSSLSLNINQVEARLEDVIDEILGE